MKNSYCFGVLLVCLFAISSLQGQSTSHVLTALPNFGPNGDGTLRPGDATNVTLGTFQRGLAYNPATGNLIFVDHAKVGTPALSGSIYVLDGATGTTITSLSTNGMAGGDYPDAATAVSDDGIIYVANLVNNASNSPFIIYRWENETSTNAPAIVYTGNPAPGVSPRWGETMDIRGSGATTQIIIGSKTQSPGSPGTNVVIFTAGDAAATNFIAHTLATDLPASDAGTSSEPGMGVAFGSGNTFWTKHKSGAPLRQLTFDLATSNATTIRLFGTNTFLGSANLGPVAVDTANNLMALGDLSLPNTVRLYDISDLSKPPLLLDLKTFPSANANGTAGGMYLDIGGGKLFVHSMNNGLMGLSIDTVPTPLPQWVLQPSGALRVIEGRSAYFEALASQATSYQWQKNGNNIPGATTVSLSFSNLLVSDSGTYSANAIDAAGTTLSTSNVTLTVVTSSNLFRLSPMWVSSVVSGNSLTPSATNYINQGGTSSTPNQRTIAYNSLSNQLYMISRGGNSGAAGSNFNIFAINATNGQYLYNLKTNGITGGIIGLVSIACADDGAIYACNMDTTSTNTAAVWRLYRWADAGPSTPPSLVFSGEPTAQSSPFRWGDAMTVRGSGVNTEVLIDNYNAANRYSAHLVPTDSSMATFTSKYQNLENTSGTTIGRSLQWGTNNSDGKYTFWQKRKANSLFQSNFDPTGNSGLAAIQATYAGFPTTLGPVAVDPLRNLAIGIDFNGSSTVPDSVALFDFTEPTAALFINRYNFGVPQFANANFIGQVILAGNYVFAIDANNGLMAFTLASGPATPPNILSLSGALRLVTGSSGSLSVSSPDALGYQWRRNGSNVAGSTNSVYSISNAQLTDIGSYVVVLSNGSGATTSAPVSVTVTSTNDVYQLTQKWQYQPGTNTAGTFTNYVTYNGGSQTPNERSIAYNALSNQLYLVQKSGTDIAVHVLDGTSGIEQYLLNTTGLLPGGSSITLDAIGVAADGAIYACAMSTDACGCNNTNNTWHLYRWADSNPNTQPVPVFQGDPAGQTSSLRWGDVMSVRGAGVSTEIVLNNYQGTFGAVLTPTDSSMSTFVSSYFTEIDASSPIGRSLQFATGSTNTIWQKRSTAGLQLLSYDLANHNGTEITNYGVFPSTLGPIVVNESRNVVVGINFATGASAYDTVDMYDTSPPLTPTLLLSRFNFPTTHQGNQNFIGQVIIGGNRVFALSCNNGLVAFDIVPPVTPVMTLTQSANSITVAWPTSLLGYGLQGTPVLTSAGWTNVTATVVTNNGQNTVTLQTSGSAQFFRLKK